VTLLTDLGAFLNEHQRCGELDGGVDGGTIWFDCGSGARIAHRAEDGDVLDLNG
jgi:hypothetical protein